MSIRLDGHVASGISHGAVFAQWNAGTLSLLGFYFFGPHSAPPPPPADSQGDGGLIITDLPPPEGAAPVSVCLHHFSGGPCRFFHSVVINLIDLDFNSFILEQLAKTLLTQKVYALLVCLFLEYSSIQI